MRPLIAVLALAACQMEPTGPVTNPQSPPPSTEECPAAEYQSLVGTPLAAVTMPAGLYVRIIAHDMAVTMDYVPERMNIWLDKNGVIKSVSCG